jgi:membrane protein YqaA with SNARE-associated domain
MKSVEKKSYLYSKILEFSNHKYGALVLNIISFLESSLLPIPPDIILIPMMIANKKRIVSLCSMCAASSIIGGCFGYAIGYFLFDSLGIGILKYYGIEDSFNRFKDSFEQWGFLIIAMKGFTPIPFKIVTIASGLFSYNFILFVIASAMTRSFRFATLGVVVWYYGDEMHSLMQKKFNLIMVFSILFIVGALFLVRFL